MFEGSTRSASRRMAVPAFFVDRKPDATGPSTVNADTRSVKAGHSPRCPLATRCRQPGAGRVRVRPLARPDQRRPHFSRISTTEPHEVERLLRSARRADRGRDPPLAQARAELHSESAVLYCLIPRMHRGTGPRGEAQALAPPAAAPRRDCAAPDRAKGDFIDRHPARRLQVRRYDNGGGTEIPCNVRRRGHRTLEKKNGYSFQPPQVCRTTNAYLRPRAPVTSATNTWTPLGIIAHPKGDLAGSVNLMAASFVRREQQRRFGIRANTNGIGASLHK